MGSVDPESFDTLHSFSNAFEMPFVTPWFPEKKSGQNPGSQVPREEVRLEPRFPGTQRKIQIRTQVSRYPEKKSDQNLNSHRKSQFRTLVPRKKKQVRTLVQGDKVRLQLEPWFKEKKSGQNPGSQRTKTLKFQPQELYLGSKSNFFEMVNGPFNKP